MTRKLFGTDGIRGVANVDPMTGEMAIQLGRAIAHLFREVKGRHRIVIGKDTRLSGYMLEQPASGICSGVRMDVGGPASHTGDCLYHYEHEGQCRGGDFCLSQSLLR
jgi:phosphoglucosamine mutase